MYWLRVSATAKPNVIKFNRLSKKNNKLTIFRIYNIKYDINRYDNVYVYYMLRLRQYNSLLDISLLQSTPLIVLLIYLFVPSKGFPLLCCQVVLKLIASKWDDVN